MTLDVAGLRAQFPILERRIGDRPLVYLDNAASAQKPLCVIEAMADAMRRSYANVHRGLHTLANESTAGFEGARAAAARLINAPTPEQIVLAKGATNAINIVANGLGQNFREGDEIVLSVAEHHSNIVPWHFLRERKGCVLRWIDIDEAGGLDLAELERAMGPRTKLVAMTHMSNVLGLPTDAPKVIAIAHAHGVPVLLDGCQAIVHQEVDVAALDVDYYAFSAHKLYGPTGIGVLYGKKDALYGLAPFEGGGEMIDRVTRDIVTYNEPPHRFEAGTPAIIEAFGFKAALEWLDNQDRAAIAAHEARLRNRALAGLRGLEGVRVFGEGADKAGIIAFNIEGAHPHDVAQILDKYGVAVRAGHHCAQVLMERLGVSATARASFAAYNTEQEVDVFLDALVKTRAMLL